MTEVVKEFCRLDKAGNIVEYPVTQEQITHRGHPAHFYLPVEHVEPVLKETLSMKVVRTANKQYRFPVGDVVVFTYRHEPKTLDEVIAVVHHPDLGRAMSKDSIQELATLIRKFIHPIVVKRLNDFAAEKGYTGVNDEGSYVEALAFHKSTIEDYQYEAGVVQHYADNAWMQLDQGIERVKVNPFLLAKTGKEVIEQLVPCLKDTWTWF